MLSEKKGFILVPLVFVLLIVVGIGQLIICFVQEESCSQVEFLHYRQLYHLGATVFQSIDKFPSGQYDLPQVVLYPGSVKVKPLLILHNQPQRQLQEARLVLRWERAVWNMCQLTLSVPGGENHRVYKAASVTGMHCFGQSLPYFSKKIFKPYQYYRASSDKTYLRDGLRGRIYVCEEGSYKVPDKLKIGGDGVFYGPAQIRIGAGTRFMGKTWFFSSGDIVIEDNAHLNNAFLYAEGRIILGKNSRVCGIILGRQDILLGDGAKVQANMAVLKPFTTAIFIY